MKAVLITDMPSNCSECPCTDYMFCYATQKELEIDWEANKPSWCPLRPLPQRNKYDVEKYATVDYEYEETLGHYLNIGWNACIDEILGETKEPNGEGGIMGGKE